MSDDGAKIVVLPTGYDPAADEAPVTSPRDLGPCRHRQVEIDKAAQRLVCRRCDQEVAPLVWIEHLANDWRWYQHRVDDARRRAESAEQAADRRVQAAHRQGRARLPMPVGKRLARIARTVGRATSELGEAQSALAEVLDTGTPGLADFHLRAAETYIGRARASLDKLIRDHGC